MYFTLKNDIQYEADAIIDEPEDIPMDVDFISGTRIREPIDEPVVFKTTGRSGHVLRDFLDSSYPLMSGRLVKLLQEAGVYNLQLFSAIVESEVDDTVWDDYFLVNVLGTVSCADLERSVYDEIMPGHYIFDELAIRPEEAGDSLLFRLEEHSPTIIIHKSVGTHIVESDPDENITGWTVGEIIQ